MLVGHIDRIEPDCVAGWAADTDTPDSIEDVILYVDGRRVAQITCDLPREDLRQLEVYGEGCHGFRWRIAPPIPNHLLRSVTVRYARSGTIVAHQEITVHGPPGLNAILVTAAGRSGTTLMMHRLSRLQQVCVAEAHPFEVRLISYWSTVVSTLTGPPDYERSMHPDRLEGDGLKVGANPFSHPDYADVFHSKTLEDEYFGTFVPRQLSETAKIAIQEYYLRLVDDRQNRQASYLAEKNNNLDKHVRNFARQLFPGLKELVLVRDPRDLVCSQVAYFTRDPKEVIKEVSFALKELTRLKREEANKVLFVRYEDLVLDSLSALRRILGYLKIEPTYSISDEGERASFKSHATSDSPSGSIGRWKSQSLLNERTWSTLKWDEFLDEFGYLEHGH